MPVLRGAIAPGSLEVFMTMPVSGSCAQSDSPAAARRGRPVLTIFLGLVLALCFAGGAAAVPSAVIHYKPSLPANLDQYAQPGNVIVVTAEQRNRNPARLRAWRARGAIVLAYVNAISFHTPYDPIEGTLTGGNFPSSWIYPGGAIAYQGQPLLNLSASCPVATYNGFTGTWGEYVAHWIRNTVIQDGSIFNGVFLDVWGDKIHTGSPVIGGPGTEWEAGVGRAGAAIRAQVGPNIFLVGNNTQTRVTAAPLNGRMWESFTSAGSGYNQLTGPNTGLIQTFAWAEWDRPQLEILWRNEANPSSATKQMLVDAANRVTRTGSDIAVGSSDHQGGFPAPFGGPGGFAPPPSTVPGVRGTLPARAMPTRGSRGRGSVNRRPLLSSEFRRGSLAPWKALMSRGASVRATGGQGGRVTLVARRGTPSFAALSTSITPEPRVTLSAKLKLARLTLPNTRARALLSVGSADGRSRQVGVRRDSSGVLRWAMWTRIPSGGRIELVASKVAVPLKQWVTLRLKTNWASGPPAGDSFAVDGRVMTRSPAGSLAGKRAENVVVGFGRNSTNAESAVGVVGSVSVVARD